LGRSLPNKKVIAVVDDDRPIREALTSLIRSLGYASLAFDRAEALLKSKRVCAVDCIIADVQMPGLTGPDLYDQLVASGLSTPMILITAYPDERVRERALNDGVTRYLVKPFSDSALLNCIAAILRER
jgi:FixJ family two-component response regulator